MTKIMTVRIEDDLNDEINAVARADDAPASEVVRAALYHYIAARKSDPQFQTRLRELLEKDAEVIGRLAAGLAG
jgi:predicted transcriptional regulator